MRFNPKCNQSKWTSLLLLFLLIFNLSNAVFAQTDGKVSGLVTDANGSPIPGATVAVKGKGKATSTNVTGAFTIAAIQGDVLIVSSVGFTTQSITVTAQKRYKVALVDANTALKEVVVVGYGTSSRKTLSSSVVSVKAEELNKGSIADVGQLLQGKVPGLNITASGDPNKQASVVLRGASTINSSSTPFYVIDGIPGGDITAVAPADIESIDVLKDAAATAIYGNRAASGVIMVTTKRGKKGSQKVTYSGYVGQEKVSSKLNLMNADQLRSFVTSNNSSFSPSDDVNSGNINTDWMGAIQRSSAYSQNHNISMQGGSEHSVYAASVNYFKKDGILSASSLERVIARLNLDQSTWEDRLKFSLSVSNSVSNSNNVPLQNVVLLQAAKHMPISPIYNADGSFFENFNTTGYFNPVAMVANAQDQTKYNVLMGSFNTTLKLPFDLTYHLNLSYQKTQTLHGEYYGSYYNNYPSSNFYNNPDPGIGISHSLISFGTNGSAMRSDYGNNNKIMETFFAWDKKIGNHSINAVLGYSYQDNVYGEGFQASSTNFATDNVGFQNLMLGNPYAISSYRINLGADNTYGEYLMISDFARVNYSYKDKYLFQGSIRRDGSSVFGGNNRWGYFPSFGVAWRISEEDFMKKQTIISDLKLRYSYGVTGNSSGIGTYTANLVYNLSGTYYNNGSQVAAYAPFQGANPDLKWETTNTSNIGLDFALFNNRISGSIEYYDKNTNDMLFQYTVPSSQVPGGRIWANGGAISNKGVEVSLNATPIQKKGFSWSTTMNLAFNKNKITSLKGIYGNSDSTRYSDPEGAGQTNATLQLLKVGYPVGQFFAYRYAGKDASNNSTFYLKNGTVGSTPGIGTDYFYIGDPQPSLLLGWSNSFKYKNFDLSFFLRGSFGNKIFDATRADLSNVTAATINNILVSANGDNLKDAKNSYYSDRYVEDGSYLRLDNTTLGYNLKAPFKNVSNIRFYVTGNNLFTITGYKGIDPEITQGGVSAGIDYNNFYPKTRTIMLGVNVSF